MDTYNRWSDFIAASLDQFLGTLGAYLPSLLAALALVLLGWLSAHLLRAFIKRLGAGTDRLISRIGLGSHLQALRLPWSLSQFIATTVYWLVILFFLTAAAEIMGLPGIATWLSEITAYLPMIFAAAIIILIGYLLATFLRDSLAGAGVSLGMREARLLGQIVYVSVLIVAMIIGAGQLGIDVSLLTGIVTAGIAALFGAMALAFGLGARESVANIIAAHYVQRSYKVGENIRIGELEGQILELTPTAVILDTRDGRAMIPAKEFAARSSFLLISQEHKNGE